MTGFDNAKYIETQSEKILERINKYNNKLYLEFGGKLFDDYHASRVLPGFAPDAKVTLLKALKDKLEIIFVISAGDIERNKIRADFGITYGMDVLRLMDNLRRLGIYINSIVITQYKGQTQADVFRKKLEMRGEKVYVHTPTKGYPVDVDTIVSDEGYGANPYIETTRPLVVVTAPGPGSGKLATCLSQLYHEYKRGVRAGYAKFETFPIWNLALKHPVNIAYEAATVDIGDFNIIDPFHLDAYNMTTVNYNRDVEVFPVVKTILEKITGEEIYRSPTDMGVNMAGCCIADDEEVREAAKQEIIRRYFKINCDYKQGLVSKDAAERATMLMNELKIVPTDRAVVAPAREKAELRGVPAMALMTKSGEIVTGRQSEQMQAAASLVLNTLKTLSGLSDDIMLISPSVMDTIMQLKRGAMGNAKYRLTMEDALIAVSITAASDPISAKAMEKVEELRGLEVHSTVMLSQNEENTFRRMRMNVTADAEFASKDLFYL
ncbi:MAG: DUF1846 domain-containing protein [Clostridia bacterium]|nr:DUF1846 domain-containing protein [Clostridia bacterium]